jgi:CheY-like chemotaxis protein
LERESTGYIRKILPCVRDYTDSRSENPHNNAIVPPPGVGSVILLAEDEPQVRQFIVAALECEKMTVLSAANAAEALDISRRRPEKIDLLVTDLQMGRGMNGIQLADCLRRERPGLPVLLLSGSSDAIGQAEQEGLPFLAKPFGLMVLIEQVQSAMKNRVAEPAAPVPDLAAAKHARRLKLQMKLHCQVRNAAEAYRAAVAQAKILIESQQVGCNDQKIARALRRAAACERMALRKYSGALKAITGWLVHGQQPVPREAWESLLDAAIESTAARKGAIHVLDRARGDLRMQAQRGFAPPFVTFFERLREAHSEFAKVLSTARRLIVEDVSSSPLFDEQSRRTLLDAGIQAVQFTPLLDPSGGLIGVLSTHYARPTCPTFDDLKLLDGVAAEATVILLEERRH